MDPRNHTGQLPSQTTNRYFEDILSQLLWVVVEHCLESPNERLGVWLRETPCLESPREGMGAWLRGVIPVSLVSFTSAQRTHKQHKLTWLTLHFRGTGNNPLMCYRQSLEWISLYLHVIVFVYLARDQLRVLAVFGAFSCFVAIRGMKPRASYVLGPRVYEPTVTESHLPRIRRT